MTCQSLAELNDVQLSQEQQTETLQTATWRALFGVLMSQRLMYKIVLWRDLRWWPLKELQAQLCLWLQSRFRKFQACWDDMQIEDEPCFAPRFQPGWKIKLSKCGDPRHYVGICCQEELVDIEGNAPL
eukprot:4903027-Amphidinium_carterae.1